MFKAGDENRTRDNSLEGCSFTTKLHPLIIKRNGARRNRTADTWSFNPLLYQLSYRAFLLLREQDLNLRPSGYEPDELPNCSIPRYVYKGGCGIRTHARFYTPDGFQDRSLQPDLGNPPINIIVRTGFEPVLPP